MSNTQEPNSFDVHFDQIIAGAQDEIRDQYQRDQIEHERSLDFDVEQLNATMERINVIMNMRGGSFGLGQQDTTDLKQELVRIQFILGQAFPKLKKIRKEIFKLQGSVPQDQSFYLPL